MSPVFRPSSGREGEAGALNRTKGSYITATHNSLLTKGRKQRKQLRETNNNNNSKIRPSFS